MYSSFFYFFWAWKRVLKMTLFLSELWLAFGQLGEHPHQKFFGVPQGAESVGWIFVSWFFTNSGLCSLVAAFYLLPWPNRGQMVNKTQNSFASNNQCHLMKNSCGSLKLVSKKDWRNGKRDYWLPFETICCSGKVSTEMTFELRSVPVTNV